LVITPVIAAIIIGSFWTGVGATAVLHSDLMDSDRSDVVITAEASPSTDADHVEACQLRYRSYNEDTDMYLGYDGSWHVCML
jgi:hypothetical protein